MDWLNYHHLRYFWAVAKEGSIARASKLLHVSPPSISTQLRQLEQALGEKLLHKHGRQLQPTEMGRMVQVYAEQIFALGTELLDAVKDRPTGQPMRLQVGIADVVPKQLAFRLLSPVFALQQPVRLVVREDRPDRLLAELAVFGLDLVIADVPASGHKVRAFHHPLGQSPVAVFGTPQLVRSLRARFPASLQDQPFLLPLEDSALRAEFDAFLRERDLHVRIVGECEDSALLKTFARAGRGLLCAPSVLAKDLRNIHGLHPCGTLPDVTASYFAITVERKVKHPAVAAILHAARSRVFAG